MDYFYESSSGAFFRTTRTAFRDAGAAERVIVRLKRYSLATGATQTVLTLDSNAYLTTTPSTWNTSRHTDPKVDDYYARYAKELDAGKRKAIAKELAEYMADKMYWNVISGSPFFMVAQPWMKGYTYNAEFEVHWNTVWLDK